MKCYAARLMTFVMAFGSMVTFGAVSSLAVQAEEQTSALIAEEEITAVNSYEDSAAVNELRPISECTVSADDSSCVYNGQKQLALITVKDEGKTLVKGTDYTLSYTNCVNAGTVSVIIRGIGNYTGTNSVRYTIAKAELSDCSVSGIKDSYNYTGSAIVPSARLTNPDGKKLIVNKDYAVSFNNNTAAGTATVTFRGKGNYTGSIISTFRITAELANVTGMTATSVGTNSVTLRWNKVSGAQGYVVYLYDKTARKWTRYKKTTTTANTITVTGLNAGEAYAFTARAYVMSGTKEILSPSFTNYKLATCPAKVNFTITARLYSTGAR